VGGTPSKPSHATTTYGDVDGPGADPWKLIDRLGMGDAEVLKPRRASQVRNAPINKLSAGT
jgi:hypothetical protein